MEHVAQTEAGAIQADVAAAVAWLRSPEGGARERVFTVGFCFGGRHSWLAAAGGHGLAGAVGFYGRPASATASPGPMQLRAPRWRRRSSRCRPAPTQNITAEDNAAFDEALTAAGVEHEVVTYDGRAAQLLRPQAGRAPGGLRRRLGARHRVHRRALLTARDGSVLLKRRSD